MIIRKKKLTHQLYKSRIRYVDKLIEMIPKELYVKIYLIWWSYVDWKIFKFGIWTSRKNDTDI